MLRRFRPVASRVHVATSRRDATNSVLLTGPGRGALLIDPAWTPDELDGVAADVAELGVTLEGVLSTHGHFDHLLWQRRFAGAPRRGSVGTARAARAPMLGELGPGFPPGAFRTAPPVLPLRTASVPWSGPAVRAIVTDAHAPGHTSFWLEQGRVLIAGDLLSDVEVPLPAEDDASTAAYRAGLDALEPLVRRAALVIPGHGSPGADGDERLRRDRAWLDALETGEPPAGDPRTGTPANRTAWTAALHARRHLG